MTDEKVLEIPKNEFYESVKMEYRKYFEPIPEPESSFPDGRINIDCPCLHSALAHKCGHLIRDALVCFNASQTFPRGMDCEKPFMDHAVCMTESNKKQ